MEGATPSSAATVTVVLYYNEGGVTVDIVTYAAANGITVEDATVVLEEMGTAIPEKASVEAMMEALLNKGPRDGRLAVVGSARAVPLAYSY